jgi:hypothetical protein
MNVVNDAASQPNTKDGETCSTDISLIPIQRPAQVGLNTSLDIVIHHPNGTLTGRSGHPIFEDYTTEPTNQRLSLAWTF